jgi:lipid-binding SYLF domain-containing protein
MKVIMKTGVLALLIGAVVALPAQAQKQKDLDRVEEAKATMIEKDAGMADWFNSSYAYAVFPNVGKGGIGIGGAHGNGIVYRGGAPVGKSELKQVTIGLQLGGQKFIEVVFFKDKTAYDDFTRGNYEFGAQASAVAFSASASADLAYNGGVAIVTMAEGGLMYEATVGGQKFEYEAYGE